MNELELKAKAFDIICRITQMQAEMVKLNAELQKTQEEIEALKAKT